ncbi:MAG: MFS transporter [Candidatus Dormibacteria bacterium]
MGTTDTASAPTPHGWRRLLTEPRRPAAIAAKPNAHWYVVGTVCVGAFMGQLDASIVVLALPTLQTSFHATLGAVEWVSLAYLLVLVAMVTAVGRFADMVGRKLLYIYGFAIFIVGTALCGLAPNIAFLVGFRILQGFGAAMLQANSVALIVQAMPPDKLGRAIGVQGAAQALGLSLGPAVGGLLVVLGGWRLIFLVNVPAGMIGMALGWFLLPRSRHLAERQRIDWWGIASFGAAISGLMLALSFGNETGWLSPQILGFFAVTLVFGALFLRRELTARAPMMQLGIFKVIAFSAGISSGLLSYLALFGILFVLPFYLEFAGHLNPGTAGLELIVLPLALGFTAPVAGNIADRIGAQPLTVGGMVLCGVSLIAIALHPVPGGVLLIELAVTGAGLGMFTPPNNAAIMGAAPRQHSGMASGILNMTRGMGTSLGVALTGLVFGLAAGTSAAHAQSPALATRGLVAALLFLAAVSFVAAGVAALRGRTRLNSDPTLTAEG